MYLNCENNKKLPFKSKFKEYTITDPMQVYEAFTSAESNPDIHTIVVDTVTYLMDMFESCYVLGSPNTMQMWGEYAQFLKKLMSQYVAKSTKNVIFLAHTSDVVSEDAIKETLVKVKGSLMNQGVESFFSTVISTKKIPIKKLSPNSMLNITPREQKIGFKYVFQTVLTKQTLNERMRSSWDMWAEAVDDGDLDETYIDNDAQHVIDRLHDYYN